MYETLLGIQNKVSPRFPDSGPGPESFIAGDTVNGYYGITQANELFTIDEVSAAGPLTAGTVNPFAGADMWLKFSRDGKTLYMPRLHLRENLTWVQLYAAGFVYGVTGPGPKLWAAQPGGDVDQMRTLTKVTPDGRTFLFKIRLIQGMNTDPSATPAAGVTNLSDKSEWDQLFCRVAGDIVNRPVSWSNLSMKSNGNLGITIFKETWSTVASYGFFGFWTNAFAKRDNNLKNDPLVQSQPLCWRPCLELVSVTPAP